MNRRSFLLGAGGLALALPFLEARRARAAPPPGTSPKRFIVFSHHQGTVMNQWVPTGSATDFELGPILSPLEARKDRLTIIAGLDNQMPRFNSAGNGHENADLTLLTARPFLDQSAAVLQAGGPSIDHVIAQRISASQPYSRLDFGIGGGTAGSGLLSANQYWQGAGDPAVFTTDPSKMFSRLFGATETSEEEVNRLRARRASVLDAVQAQFKALRKRLDRDDRARLDAHADKIRALEQRVTAATGECSRPNLSIPSGYDYGFDDDLSGELQLDLLVHSLSCDLTRVATVWFASGHDPTFPWLTVNGGPVVPAGAYDNWHGMVHDGRDEPGLVAGFQWYNSQLALLLDKLAATTDADGDNLLDTTLVMAITEFGNGSGHNTLKIPVVLAGDTGEANGRFIDLLAGGPDADWESSDYSLNQLYVSLLQRFGGTDTTFGHTDPSLPEGPLPGLFGA